MNVDISAYKYMRNDDGPVDVNVWTAFDEISAVAVHTPDGSCAPCMKHVLLSWRAFIAIPMMRLWQSF